jgi:hypothetical protein
VRSSHGDPLCACGARLYTAARRAAGRCLQCEKRQRPLFVHCETPGCVALVINTRYPGQWRVCPKCRKTRCVVCGRRFTRKSRNQITCGRSACRKARAAVTEKARFAMKGRLTPRPKSVVVTIQCVACRTVFTYIAKLCPSGSFPGVRCYCNRCRHRQRPSPGASR